MNVFNRPSRSMKVFYTISIVALVMLGTNAYGNYQQEQFEKVLKGKAPTRKGEVKQEVINASPMNAPAVAAAPPGGFTPQTRLGYTVGDQWEPAIAADRFGHVYMLYAQYEGVPGCPTCSNPTQILQISNDHGTTWGNPRVIYPAGGFHWRAVGLTNRRRPC